jgi:hypothetical protein
MSNTLARERADRIANGDAEWRAQSAQHRIVRQHGTERAALTFKPGDP